MRWTSIPVALFSALLASGCGTHHATPSPPQPNGLIAYVVGLGGNSGLTVRDLRTGVPRLITPRGRDELEILGWSRDGRTLRYVEHLPTGGLDLYVLDIQNSTDRRVRHYRVDGTLAPSERFVANGTESCKYDRATQRDVPLLLRIRVFGRSRLRHDFLALDRPVTVSTAGVAEWSPDESKLAYEVTEFGFSGSCGFNLPATTLYEARVDGTQRRQVADRIEYAGQIGYSRDSTHLAFTASCDVNLDFCERLLVWDGHKTTDLMPHRLVGSGFVWSKAGEIVFLTTRLDRGSEWPRTYRLMAAQVDTKGVRTLGLVPLAGKREPSFITFIEPVQKRLAFFTRNSQLFAASLDGGRPLWRAPWGFGTDSMPGDAAVLLR